jgi:uncharacterized protein (DUF488 family)
MSLRLFTIGFTQKSAEQFFTLLQRAGVRRVVDVRLNNVSQLAGFAKRDDLRYFLQSIGGIDYTHLPDLAPTQEMLDAYKKQKGDWAEYERRFLALMSERQMESTAPERLHDGDCLLCSEHEPDCCHRRLVCEYLAAHDVDLEVTHLL